jgi:hypothetical protein
VKVEYVYNERGEKTGVIIPVSVWNKISGSLGEEKKKGGNVKQYRGMLKDTENLDARLHGLRDEWDRT